MPFARHDLFVAEAAKDFEHLAPGREHPPAALLVLVHGHHELHLGLRVFPLTGCRVDESASAAELAGHLPPEWPARRPGDWSMRSTGPIGAFASSTLAILDTDGLLIRFKLL